jgi:predicted transcriptional regulator
MNIAISKFITYICEKDYSKADSLLQKILTEKVKQKVKKIVKEKGYCCDDCKKKKKHCSDCKKNNKTVSKKGK